MMRREIGLTLVLFHLISTSCKKEEVVHAIPVLTTLDVVNITETSASSGGNVISTGGLEIIERGLCWSLNKLPTTADSKVVNTLAAGTGTGTFRSGFDELLGGKTYYLRAYATNNLGTAYGNEVSFTTTSSRIVQIQAAEQYTVVLKSDLSAWVWGSNESHQLGDGTTTDRNRPILLGMEIYRISSTNSTTLALKTDMNVWGCGSNLGQQLGPGSAAIFAQVPGATGFTEISSGTYHVLALKNDRTLWAWGKNSDGQLGDGTNIDRTTPVMIGFGFVAIAAGAQHSMALKLDGSLWTWGDNFYGQLGDGTNVDKNTPTLIGTGYAKIATAYFHSLAINTNGILWSWGSNSHGQLGDGTNQQKNVPTFVNGAFDSIAAGEDVSFALQSNGVLWAWGINNYGQLGTGGVSPLIDPNNSFNPSDKYSPVMVGSEYIDISSGRGHTLGLKKDYTLWVWGSNTHGQLGNGKSGNQYSSGTPTQFSWD